MDRLIDIGEDEMWTDFLEEVNKLLHEEKVARHENDAVKLSELCRRIVSYMKSIIIQLIESYFLRQNFDFLAVSEHKTHWYNYGI